MGRRFPSCGFVVVGIVVLLAEMPVGVAEEPLQMVPAVPPERAAETIRLQDGFRAELIAAEPLVTDPVDIAYDENGLAYVAEMNDYPYADPSEDRPWEDQSSEPIGKIRLLEDTDGDGRYDKSEIFADKLSWPAGITCWKGGVYVAATPDLLYLKDTDGDGKADVRRVVFTGFRKYNVQAVMNNLKWGLDNRIYAAGSGNGGTITAADMSSVAFGRNDFRFRPGEEKFELVAGGARFGNSFDDWGHRFLCNIRNPVQQVLFPEKYRTRNRYLMLPSLLNDVASSGDAIQVYPVSPPEPWRVIHADRLANAPTKNKFDSTQPAGYVTSSSGVTIYRGAAYPPEFSGNAFVGEVAGNLVIRYALDRDGVSYTGRRPYENADFLASTDNWFRPVNFANAPDGTLHVLDMYRQTIEHPWSLPDDLQQRLSLTEGRDRGRIYRLLPPEFPEGFMPPPSPRLGSATTAELVAELENPNGWWRDTAHRLIFERQDASAVPGLRDMLRTSKVPLARLHAMWSLHGLDALTAEDLVLALNDADPGVQVHAVQIAETERSDDGEIQDRIVALADSPDAQLRFQVALTLGELARDDRTEILTAMLRRDGSDAWMRAAVLSSLGDQELPLLSGLLADPEFVLTDTGTSIFLDILATAAARNGTEKLMPVVDSIAGGEYDGSASGELRYQTVIRIGNGLRRQGVTLSRFANSGQSAGAQLVGRLLADAAADAVSSDVPVRQRLRAVDLLVFADYEVAFAALAPLLHPREPEEIQSATVTALSQFGRPEVAALLIERCASFTPAVQDTVVNHMLGRSDWLIVLFNAMLAGKIPPGRVATVRQEIYLKSTSDAIRERAEKLFATTTASERAAIVDGYRKDLPAVADVERGRIVYEKNCANCHKSGSLGFEVGPHLSTVKNRTPAELIVNILDPNREISPNFLTYVVATTEGLIHNGVVVAENPVSVTLRGTKKTEVVIFREEIEEFQNLGKSLMPEGLEKEITPPQMADLIAFIKAQ